MQKIILSGAMTLLIATAASAYNMTHPNLKDAYGSAQQAIEHIQAAQQANKGIEFGGHAEKALDLFKQAESELVEADKYNDSHQKKK